MQKYLLCYYLVGTHSQCGKTRNLLSLEKCFVKTAYTIIQFSQQYGKVL